MSSKRISLVLEELQQSYQLAQSRRKGYVYVIAETLPGVIKYRKNESRLLKIGMTENPKKRLNNLNGATGSKIQHVIVYKKECGIYAKEVEDRVHKCFEAWRRPKTKDWFDLPKSKAIEAIRCVYDIVRHEHEISGFKPLHLRKVDVNIYTEVLIALGYTRDIEKACAMVGCSVYSFNKALKTDMGFKNLVYIILGKRK